jgi:hypothetical protein
MISSIVFVVAAAVVLIGAVAGLRETIAQRHEKLSPEEALTRLTATLDGAAVLSWTALAAIALLIPALLRGVQPTLTNAGVVILALGMAAEQANYLATRWSTMAKHSKPVRVGISTLVAVGALAVGLTL